MIDVLRKKGVFLDNKRAILKLGSKKSGFFKGVKP